MFRRHATAAVIGLATLLATSAAAQDEPRVRARWTMEVARGPLDIVTLHGEKGLSTTHTYVTFKVTNTTGTERRLALSVLARTDTGKTYRALATPAAEAAIRKRTRNARLVNVQVANADLAPGASREVAAVFGEVDPHWDRLTVTIEGLVDPVTTFRTLQFSAGGKVIVDPVYAKRNEQVLQSVRAAAGAGGEAEAGKVVYERVVERRVWRMDYARPGDEFTAHNDPIRFVWEGWDVLEPEPRVLPHGTAPAAT